MAVTVDVEARTQELGRALLDAAEDYRPGVSERIEDWLLTHAVADERFRVRLLRYMDVLASLDHDRGGEEAKRLAREYFGDEFPTLPRPLRWLLRIARDEHLPAPLVGETARRSAELFARRFITPPGADTVSRNIAYLAKHGRVPSFDLLGEAVLSESEARSYLDRYMALVDQLVLHPAAGTRTVGGIATLQLSIKLSSLTSLFTPVDPAGSIARVRPSLEAIAEACRQAGIGLTVDMEQYAYRDLTWEVFRRTFARGERFGDWHGAGIVLQSYLRDAEAHAEAMVAFARERGTPFQVRLVKGAYWDYETIVARANRWPVPVWTEKAATDASFERTLAVLIQGHPHLNTAVGSHNARAHAYAEALAAASGLPPSAVEHQTLFRTYEGMSRGIAELGWPARDYVPVGELLPGMAYLVRRVLENSSQAGFLLQSRGGAPREELLRPPPERDVEPAEVDDALDAFERAPEARWFDAAFRVEFESAFTSTRARWGEHYELPLDGIDPLPREREGEGGGEDAGPGDPVPIHSPSHPDAQPIGTVTFASAETAHRAASYLHSGSKRWAATPVDERAAVLHRAAGLLQERAHEFAAWIVHEGGRDRAGAWAEVVEAIDYLRYYAVEAERLFANFEGRIAPRGAVAVIPPWNFSLAIPCGMTVAALACGNGVVLKPSGQTPLIALRLVALLHQAGVPPEALVCLPGSGSEAGQALVDSPEVAMIAFTGSRAVGTRMHEDVSRVEPRDGVLKAIVAEMGGKNAAVVFDDADLDETVDAVLHSAFGHANQKCSAVSRVLVEASIYERFRDRLLEAARSLHVGSADAPATQVNPIIDRRAWDRLQEAAALAREECTVLLDMFEAPPLQAGPLIVELAAERALNTKTSTEELFGPILVLIPFADEADAYRIANGTAYGLTAGVFSRSPRTIERATRAIEAGNVYVNRVTTGARPGIEPFGGMRMSGTGPKAGGPDYLWAFVRRLDAPADQPQDAESLATAMAVAPEMPPDLAPRWDVPLEERLAAIERAAVLLSETGNVEAVALLDAAQAARRELGRPVPTVRAAGQQTELRYDTARGHGLLRVTDTHAGSWLAAALLAGNSVAVVDAPALAMTVAALHRAGVPAEALHPLPGDIGTLLATAEESWVDFAVVDCGPSIARAVYRRLGPTAEGQRSLKALLSPLDGAQPGEPGFTLRFAWPKVIATRTLRHGAELAIEATRAM
jgi:RHH-type transcriptional regulator, proline utilization regulon repressor / proline dehydrogenase / delta 1-pyrroline-5-carboxylate dehydrogenase